MPKEMGESRGESWDDDDLESEMPPTPEPPPARRRPSTPTRVESNVPAPTPDEVSQHVAAHLSETSASAFMYFTMAGVFRQADALAFKKYRDRLLVECGRPTDPIEIMLIEQLALAHLNTGRLHFKSATAEGLEATRTYGALAIALGGEFRRSALALKSYRDKPQLIETEVATADVGGPDTKSVQKAVDSELGTNTGDNNEGTIPLPEPLEGRSRTAEPGQTPRIKRRRA